MNIHNVRDRRQTGVRQTDVRRQTDIRGQTASLPNALPRRWRHNKLCGRPPQYVPVPCKLTFDLLTLKLVSELRVTWATSVPILVFLGLSVLDLGPMYATDRQTSDAHHRLMPPTLGAGHNNYNNEKSARRSKHCALAVVRRSQNFRPAADPFPGARNGQNLISWRWSLPSPTDPVW